MISNSHLILKESEIRVTFQNWNNIGIFPDFFLPSENLFIAEDTSLKQVTSVTSIFCGKQKQKIKMPYFFTRCRNIEFDFDRLLS